MAECKKSYSEKLKDPRWQKKRLEILERDEWKCKICENTDRTLHIHHKYYDEKTHHEPWNIAKTALVTLCEKCHDKCDNDFYYNNELAKSIYNCGAIKGQHLQATGMIIEATGMTFLELLRHLNDLKLKYE